MKVELSKKELLNLKFNIEVCNDALSKLRNKVNNEELNIVSIIYTNNILTLHKIESYLHENE